MTDVHIGARKPRLNPFVFPSDTDFRFFLLIVSVISASLFIYAYLYSYFPANLQYSHNTAMRCFKEANAAHPGNSLTAIEARLNNFQQCQAATLGRAEFIWTIGGMLLLLLLATILCWVLPFWKIWQNHLVRLGEEDVPEVAVYLKDLCHEAELTHFPIFMWNPLKLTQGGLAFGSFGRSYVALDGGLVQQFYTDPPAFRAVVLHELGHLRNADTGKTYFTIAIGWAFLIAALLPLVVILIFYGWSHGWDGLSYFDIGWRILALTVLVYLTRSAVLRAREVYADLRASVWDRPNEALDRVLDTLPRPRRRWKNPLDFHPHPDERRRILNDTFRLFHMGFWEAFATGIAFTITVLNVGFMLGLLHLVMAEIVVPGLIIALPVVGVVVLGTWRSTFVQLMRDEAPSSIWQLGLGLGLGLLAGQSLSLVGYLMHAGYFSDLFIPGFSQSDLPSLAAQLSLGILESIPLLLVLLFFCQWIVTSASVWLEVASTYSSPRFICWIGLLISGILLGELFGLLYEAYLTASIIKLGAGQLLWFFASIFTSIYEQPLTLIVSIGLWAYPLAAWLWRKRVIATTETNWMFLDSSIQQEVSVPQPPLRPDLALMIGLAGGIVGDTVLAMLVIGLRADLTEFTLSALAVLIQGCVAAVAAGKVQQLDWIHGLFAAFVAGCIMALGIMGIRWAAGEIIDLNLTWTLTINVGVLVALGTSVLARWIRQPGGQPLRTSAAYVPSLQQDAVRPSSPRGIYRLSGIALLLGSLFLILEEILMLSNRRGALALPIALLAVVGGIILLFGLPGFHMKQAKGAGWYGIVGITLVVTAWIINDLINGFSLFASISGHSVLSSVSPLSNLNLYLIVPADFVLGIAVIRAAVYPRWVGVISIAVGLASIINFLQPFTDITGTINSLDVLLFATVYIRCGYLLLA